MPQHATEIQADAPRGAAHSQDSSLREQALGHRFLAELLSLMWRDSRRDIEVLKSEVDRAGYDIVLEANGIIRHVQLKSSFIGSKVRDVSVNTKLLAKPGGCVTWLEFDPDTLAIRKYLWFGGSPGSALPGPSAQRSPGIRRPIARVKSWSGRCIACSAKVVSNRCPKSIFL